MSQQSKLSIFYRLLPAALLLKQSRSVIQTKMCSLKRKKVELSARNGLKNFLGYSIITVCRQRKPFASYCTKFGLSTLERHEKSKQQLILYFSYYSQNVYTDSFILTPKVKEMTSTFGDRGSQ